MIPAECPAPSAPRSDLPEAAIRRTGFLEPPPSDGARARPRNSTPETLETGAAPRKQCRFAGRSSG